MTYRILAKSIRHIVPATVPLYLYVDDAVLAERASHRCLEGQIPLRIRQATQKRSEIVVCCRQERNSLGHKNAVVPLVYGLRVRKRRNVVFVSTEETCTHGGVTVSKLARVAGARRVRISNFLCMVVRPEVADQVLNADLRADGRGTAETGDSSVAEENIAGSAGLRVIRVCTAIECQQASNVKLRREERSTY